MTWLQTYSGKAFVITDPDPKQICIKDIAHALSNQCRFAGHSTKFYSVAEHSVLVHERVTELMESKGTEMDRQVRAIALLHDASETYLLDFPRPLKVEDEMGFYRDLHDKTMRIILEKYGLPTRPLTVVKQADNELLATEKEQIMTKPPRDWVPLPDPLPITLGCWSPPTAAFTFLKLAESLGLKD